jgi:hypothetical protein
MSLPQEPSDWHRYKPPSQASSVDMKEGQTRRTMKIRGSSIFL